MNKGQCVIDWRDQIYAENLYNGTHFIPLTHGKLAIVDPEDYQNISQYSWYLNDGGYALTNLSSRVHVRMHRLIMNAPEGMFVDHINHDRLDNRKCNLRICTFSENSRNRRKEKGQFFSKYLGVSRVLGRQKKWQAGIYLDGKRLNLGKFFTEEEAALARDRATRKYYGEFGTLNFPQAA